MKKKDILLVNAFSWVTDKRPCYLPYGVLYLASFLKKRGLKVDLYDRNVDYSPNPSKCIDYFKKTRPPIVAFSVLTGPVIVDALKISQAIKTISPKTQIIWGGLHPTIFPKNVLKEKSVDFIIQGEGEMPLYELSLALLNGKDYRKIKNLGYKSNHKLILNPMKEELLDLDSNPLPAYELVDMKYYLAKRFFASRVLTISSSRGCPNKCTFCFNQGLRHQRWRGLSAENIIKQMGFLHKKYGVNGIQFYEDSFDTNKKRVKDFCDLMIKSGLNKKISWSHFSNIAYFDPRAVSYEKKAGLRYIEYGVESGSQKILDWVKKNQTVAQIRNVFNQCKALGIKTGALFMIGFPNETLKELNLTVKLVEELPAHILICTIYRPYPKTPLFDYCVAQKKFEPPKDLEEQAEFYRFSHMKEDELNLSRIPTKVLVSLQRRFYAKSAVAEILLCLKTFNFPFIFYYLKQQFNLTTLRYTINSLVTRFILVNKKRVEL